jgi:signal transduction histidine kinase
MNHNVEPIMAGPAAQTISPRDAGFLGSSILLRAAVRRVLDEGHNVLHGLRTRDLSPETIEQALSGVLEDFSLAGVRYEICVTGKPKSLRPAILEQITLIGREALVNALLHSDATRVEAEVEYSSRRLRLIVRDNGRGMDSPVAQTGVWDMRARAGRIGAQFRIWSRSGAGTEVEISVPNHIAANA